MPNLLRSLGHTLAALTTNGRQFNAAWTRAGDDPVQCRRWLGEWRSQTNGHHGALRCVLRRLSDSEYDAFFHARYGGFLRVCYRVRLHALPGSDRGQLEGEADLGALAGGVYTYRGDLQKDRLTCSYACRYDQGEFQLQLVTSPNQAAGSTPSPPPP